MDKDDIIKFAREAGLIQDAEEYEVYGVWVQDTEITENIEHFFHASYAAGAAAERKKLFALLRQMQDAYALESYPPRGNT